MMADLKRIKKKLSTGRFVELGHRAKAARATTFRTVGNIAQFLVERRG